MPEVVTKYIEQLIASRSMTRGWSSGTTRSERMRMLSRN